jgi:ATP-binding cassette subfamily F protein 3
VRDLSGGEKGRLALAKLIYSGVNVLVLDEPTNHLDIPSREALEEALEAYEGTIVTISHDRFFLDKVATQILALDGEGNVEHYHGDYTEYHDWKAARGSHTESPSVAAGQSANSSGSEARPSGRTTSASRNARQSQSNAKRPVLPLPGDGSKQIKVVKKARSTEIIETEIAAEEKRITELTQETSKPEVARDIDKLVAVNDAYEAAQARLAELYDEWERAESALSVPAKKPSRR